MAQLRSHPVGGNTLHRTRGGETGRRGSHGWPGRWLTRRQRGQLLRHLRKEGRGRRGVALRPPSAAAATPAPQNSSHRDAGSCRGSGDGGLVAGVPFSGKRACIPRLRAGGSRLSSVILFKRPVAQYTHGRMPNVTGHFWESFALFLRLEKLDRVIMEQTDLLWSLIMS